jgi:protein-disulfide isomerase
VQELAIEKPGTFGVQEVDVTRDVARAWKYGIQATPTIVVLDTAGRNAGVLVGVPQKAKLDSLIEKAGASRHEPGPEGDRVDRAVQS